MQDLEPKRTSTVLNTRDELLISLLASEAVVESRDFEIFSAEEVEELKKVRRIHFPVQLNHPESDHPA